MVAENPIERQLAGQSRLEMDCYKDTEFPFRDSLVYPETVSNAFLQMMYMFFMLNCK